MLHLISPPPISASTPSLVHGSDPEAGSSGATCRDLVNHLWREKRLDTLALIASVTTVPISIAVSEGLLTMAFGLSLVRLLRRNEDWSVPRIFWFWLVWAVLELASWSVSTDPGAGRSEVSHLLLIIVLFVAMTAFARPEWAVTAWRGLLMAASLGSLFVIGDVVWRLAYYRRELFVDSDPSLYLRTGGLLNNWMVFG